MMNISKMIKHQIEVNSYLARLNKTIEKLENDLVILSDLFRNTDNDELSYEYNIWIVRTSQQLNDMYETRDYVMKNNHIVEMHSCVWYTRF